MVSSLAISVLFLILHQTGSFDCSTHLKLVLTVAFTTVCWVATAYLGPRTDDRTLTAFYRRVRPAGPGWTRIRQAAGIDAREASSSAHDMPLALAGWTFGCAVVGADEFTAHYLAPMASFPAERETRALLLAPVVDTYVAQRPWRVALFTPSDQPMRFSQSDGCWRVARQLVVGSGQTLAQRCWLMLHQGDARAAWNAFQRFGHREDYAVPDWVRELKVHYYDFLSSSQGTSGRRGDGYESDLPHFREFRVGLATQHGYYPAIGDFIQPDRKSWQAMRGDKQGAAELSFEKMVARIQATRAAGAKAAIYIHAALFDDAAPCSAPLSESVQVDADGQRMNFGWTGPDTSGKTWRASLGSAEWRAHLLQQAGWIMELLQPDAIVVDETFAGFGYDHHASRPGATSAGAMDFYRKLRTLVRSFGNDKAVFTSDCSMSSFVLWADGEAGDHAYSSLLGHPRYSREPVRYLAALSVPYLIPASALGRAGRAAPSSRITVGMIGMGRQVLAYNLPYFLNQDDCQVVALCDVDRWRLDVTPERTASYYGERRNRCPNIPDCPRHVDFREVLDRQDVDTVMISSPDHWHVPMSVLAARAGKDICCEKPLTRSIAEGRLLSDVVTRHQRVFRTDTEFRSLPQFHRAVELVRNGRIGKLHTIRTGVPLGHAGPSPPHVDMPVPDELDYDLWLGPAQVKPYTEQRVHQREDYQRPGWMNVSDYCDGMILNWTTHLNDIAQWGNDTDRTGPVEVEGQGKFPPAGSLWDVCYEFEFRCRYANGVRLICKTDAPYTRFEGDQGWIQANFGGANALQAYPQAVLDSKIGPDELHFPLTHEKRDFLDAVKTRGQTLADAEVGHRTSSLGHLGLIAIRLGRPLRFDPDHERFIHDDEADRLLAPPPGRTPWGG